MTDAELVKQALWDAARKLITPTQKGYVPLKDSSLKKISIIVKHTTAFIDQYIELKNSIYASASLIKIAGNLDQNFDKKTTAIESLNDKSSKAISITQGQTELRRDVMTKLWNDDLYLAAGRLMQAASLGVDHNPSDMGMVEEAKRRGPLLVVFANKVTLGIAENNTENDTVTHAINQIPAQPPIIWVETKHPLEPVDDALMAYFKESVGAELWTREVLLAAGRITAARSVDLKPSWDDIEKTSKADHIGRLSVIKLAEILSNKKEDDEIFFSPLIKKTIKDIEQNEKPKGTIDNALLYAIQEKVSQYVWTAHPEYCQARANLDKHGIKFTTYGDVMLVQLAYQTEVRLTDAICELLMEKEQKRINETQVLTVSWLWRRPTISHFNPQPVSDDMNVKINEATAEDAVSPIKYLPGRIISWLKANKNTLRVGPEDITNELIEDSVMTAQKTSKKESAKQEEHEEMRKARETSWF